MHMTYSKHDGLIFNTYVSLLVDVNVANVVPNASKVRESVDAFMRFRKLCTSYYLMHRSKFNVLQHEDFAAMTNQTVLTQVGPMLKDRDREGSTVAIAVSLNMSR